MNSTYSQEFEFAKELTQKAGKIMLKYFNSEDLGTVQKEDVTPLTLADTEINKLVITEIAKKYPTHAVIGEEGNGGAEGAEYEWICDPIDGTIPYTIGLPHSFFSIALYKDKKPIFGILYNPMMDIFLEAVEGGPAFVNGKVTKVKQGQVEAGDILGFVNHKSVRSGGDYSIIMSHFIQTKVSVIADVCNTFMAMLVATGKIKCAFVTPARVWDRAASYIILRAAGAHLLSENGTITDVYPQPGQYVMFTNGEVDENTIGLMKQLL
jgi:fructose-1,6-bisphosphatase/inositol monophosphatase family enzyme